MHRVQSAGTSRPTAGTPAGAMGGLGTWFQERSHRSLTDPGTLASTVCTNPVAQAARLLSSGSLNISMCSAGSTHKWPQRNRGAGPWGLPWQMTLHTCRHSSVLGITSVLWNPQGRRLWKLAAAFSGRHPRACPFTDSEAMNHSHRDDCVPIPGGS